MEEYAYIARQPIFDRQLNVQGYELFFRASLENIFAAHADPDQATSKVISDSFYLLGMDTITGGKSAFINITEEVLLNDFVRLLPSSLVVVEILETVAPSPEVVEACRGLKEAGYTIALDDFKYHEDLAPLIELADIVKIDLRSSDDAEQRQLIRQLASHEVDLLAEKVETEEEFKAALDKGYDLFQGYFFSKPKILSARDLSPSQHNHLQILKEIQKPELDYNSLEEIIKREVALSYKFLRFCNSAFIGCRRKINSIKLALTILGERTVKKWISLITLASLGEDKPQELLVQTLIRAKFSENLAPYANVPYRSEELFMLGLLSLIDVIVGRDIGDVLHEMPIDEDIKKALVERDGPLLDFYEYVLAYENGDWEAVGQHESAVKLASDEEDANPFVHAVQWAQECCGAM